MYGANAGSIAEAFYGIPEELIAKAKEFIPADIQTVVDAFNDEIRTKTQQKKDHRS